MTTYNFQNQSLTYWLTDKCISRMFRYLYYLHLRRVVRSVTRNHCTSFALSALFTGSSSQIARTLAEVQQSHELHLCILQSFRVCFAHNSKYQFAIGLSYHRCLFERQSIFKVASVMSVRSDFICLFSFIITCTF